MYYMLRCEGSIQDRVIMSTKSGSLVLVGTCNPSNPPIIVEYFQQCFYSVYRGTVLYARTYWCGTVYMDISSLCMASSINAKRVSCAPLAT